MQIDDEYTAAGDTRHFFQNSGDLGIGEVVEEERRDRVIKGTVGEGQTECVAADVLDLRECNGVFLHGGRK